MRKSKKMISIILSVIMMLSVLSVGFSVFAVELQSIELTKESRPTVSFTASGMTRVSAGTGSFANGSVIVKTTPSGVPENSGSYASSSYNGETPEATKIFFSSDLNVTDLQVSCTDGSEDLVLSDKSVENGISSWEIVSGTAQADTFLEFTATYTYNGRSYSSRCYSYVAPINNAGMGVFSHYKYTTSNEYYSLVCVMSRVLGKGVKYSLSNYDGEYGYYNAGTAGYTSEKVTGNNATMLVGEASGNISSAASYSFELNAVKQIATVYVDTSTVTTLSDINLRMDSFNIGMNASGLKVADSTQHIGTAILQGSVDASFSNIESDGNAVSALGYDANDLQPTWRIPRGWTMDTALFKGDVSNLNDNDTFTLVNYFYTNYDKATLNKDIVNKTVVPIILKITLVDKSNLRSTINTVLSSEPTSHLVSNIYKGTNPQSWYYKSGFGNFKTALANACAVLTNETATQSEIDTAQQTLEAMYSNLVLNSADYSAVNDLLEQADTALANRSNYTAESIAFLETACDDVKYSYNLFYQSAVDTMADNLRTALANLQYAQANYTAVDTAITNADTSVIKNYIDSNSANAFNYGDNSVAYYTADFLASVDNASQSVEAAKQSVVRGLDVTHQQEVDAFASDIDEAYAAFTSIDADYTAVNAIKTYAMGLRAANYMNFTAVRNSVNKIRTGYSITKQNDVDNMAKDIVTAINNLELKSATKTALKTALDLTPQYPEAYYTPESYTAWKTLHDEGQAMYDDASLTVLDNNAITEKASAITAAFNALAVLSADKSTLKTALDLQPEYAQNYYTEQSYSAWKTLHDEGQAIYEDDTLTVENNDDIAQKAAEITQAFATLALKDADYTAFNAAVATYNDECASTVRVVTYSAGDSTVGEKTVAKYTADSIAQGNDYIFNCNKTLKINEQAVVDSYVEAINGYKDNLVESVDDTYVKVAKAEFETMQQDEYTAESWAEYAGAVDAAKNLETQEQINNALGAIVQAKNALKEEGYTFETDPQSSAVLDKDRGFIYGLEEGVSDLEGFLNCNKCTIQYTETSNGFGTGTKVEVVCNGEVVETYYVVIFGDVTGDGFVDSFDVAVLASAANYETEFEVGSAYEFAADLTKDGFVDSFDCSVINSAANYETVLPQK